MFDGVDVTIETGLGWSDLILHGSVGGAQFPSLLNTLIRVNTLTAGNDVDQPLPLFTRTLTLFGHEWDGTRGRIPLVSAGFKALMFVRSRAGRLREARDELQSRHQGMRLSVIDGKLDLAGVLEFPSDKFFENHVELSEGDTGQLTIAKLETHLLFGEGIDSPLEGNSTEREQDVLLLPSRGLHGCNCKDCFAEIELVEHIPIGLQHAIRNVLHLMRSALRDTTNCCDVRPAIQAGLKSLSNLQTHLSTIGHLGTTLDARAARYRDVRETALLETVLTAVSERISNATAKIERWVLLCERVLRQRTIGSFEEFLGQSDRAVFYRGGAQKMLFLADCLMNEFYRRAAPSLGKYAALGVRVARDIPLFASLYDAVGNIESEVNTGLVRVPARDVFLLAATLPDLWHEVGTYIFMNDLDFKSHALDFNEPGTRDLYVEMADHFGDLVVCVYGFDCRFRQFATSFLHGFRESMPRQVPGLAYTRLASAVLRLMLIADILYRSCDRSRAAPRGIALVSAVKHLVETYVPMEYRHLFANTWQKAHAAWMTKTYQQMFSRLMQLAPLDEIARRTAAGRTARPGRLTSDATLTPFSPEDDLNQAMYEVHWAITRSRSGQDGTEKSFASMAAVGRSVVLEYHRRLAYQEPSDY